MGSNTGQSTTVVKNLPEYAEPYVRNFLTRAETLSNELPTVYEDITYAAQNTDELDGIANLAARGRNGNVTISKATTYIESVLDGNYLDGSTDEFIDMLDKVAVKPTATFHDDIQALLGGNPVLMGDLSNDNLAQSICNNTPSRYNNRIQKYLYDKNYEAERKIQSGILQFGILYAAQPGKDAESLRAAGMYAREYTQGAYEDLYRKWIEEEIGKVQKNDILGNAVRALVGTQESMTSPYYRPSPMVGILGGAVAGAGMGFMFAGGMGAGGATIGGTAGSGFPVVGTLIGAGLGAILGGLMSG